MLQYGGIDIPNKAARTWTRAQFAGTREHRTDTPSLLSIGEIKEVADLFQPRFGSIAYAPGRSEAHIDGLGKVLGRGGALDPVTVVAFGQDWVLVDGHHRMAAYRHKAWNKPVPVQVKQSDTVGGARVEWAAGLSIAENKKARLTMSPEDKADAAWWAVATGDARSKLELAQAYDVSTSTIANMRRTGSALTALGMKPVALERVGWRTAQMELRSRKDDDGAPVKGWEDRKARILGKKLAPVMETRPTPAELAVALERFEPGIVLAMIREQERAGQSGEDD